MSTVNSQLKYLFTAEYEDGTKYEQPEDDVSRLHKGTKDFTPSSFRDIDQDRLVKFTLHGRGDSEYSVDLRSGHFTVNGIDLDLHDQNFDPSGCKLRLIYFREVRKDWIDGVEQEPYVNRYVFGWQTTKDGKNVQETIGVK